MGTLIEGALLFSSGSVVTLAILAGIAAIAGAMVLLEKGAGDARKATEELEKALTSLSKHGAQMAEQIKIADLQDQITALQTQAEQYRKAGLGGIADELEREIIPLQAQIAIHQTRLIDLARQWNTEVDHRLEKLNEERLAMEEFVLRTTQALEKDQADIGVLLQKKDIVDGLNEAYAQMLDLTQGQAAGAVFRSSLAAGGIDVTQIDKGVAEALRTITEELDKDAKKSEAQAKQWGDRIARGLVDGITGNLNALGDLMKAIIEAWISKNILQPFLVSLGIFSPSTFGMYVGEMVAAGIGKGFAGAELGKLGLNMNLNVQKSGKLSPFDMARDADWQRAFRETSLVAYQQGFRTPG
jgi:hypothetical protein